MIRRTMSRRPAPWALAMTLVLSACFEQPYRHYATAADAVAAGEAQRGWLPAWVPGSARDLHMQGDLDSNQWWLRADLTPAAADSLRAVLEPVSADSVRYRSPRRSGRWWFESLIQHHPENDGGLNAHLFRGTGTPTPRTTVVAFDRFSPTIYIWTSATRVR
ncbi:MAG TPA: hypothetical protein VLK84_30960 [Longimicrobium sp.]|nr:hypothetical protein [Longimicrobium sp.]